MNQFNVDFFDRQLEYVHHDIIDIDAEIDNDLLSPNTSEIRIKKTKEVPVPGFVHLTGDFVFDGVVDSVSQEEDETVVTIKPFICMFDHNAQLNASLQKGSNVLEAYMRSLIRRHWATDETDVLMQLPMQVTAITSTSNWTLDLEAGESGTFLIGNILTDIIEPAFERYGIVTDGKINFNEKRIDLTIGKVYNAIIIDADNPMINIVEFVPNKMDGDVNLLQIFKNDDYSTTTKYYLHPDGTYDTTNSNRIAPVVYDCAEVSVNDGSTFAQSAADQADSVFGKYKYKNYVEFETQMNDDLVKPYEIAIGTKAFIYHDGSRVDTMLTGIKYGEYATLTFGTVRFDYTKRK